MLTLALTAYEAGLCKQCGNPLVLCRDPESDGWWEASPTICYATAATEQWRRNKPKDWEPEPGQLLFATLAGPDSPEDQHPSAEDADDDGEHRQP